MHCSRTPPYRFPRSLQSLCAANLHHDIQELFSGHPCKFPDNDTTRENNVPIDINHMFPLSIASSRGHLESVKLLLQYTQMSIDEHERRPTWTAFHVTNMLTVALQYLVHSRVLSINGTSRQGEFTPVMLACEKGHADVLHELLQWEPLIIYGRGNEREQVDPYFELLYEHMMAARHFLPCSDERAIQLFRTIEILPSIIHSMVAQDLVCNNTTAFLVAIAHDHHHCVAELISADDTTGRKTPRFDINRVVNGQSPLFKAIYENALKSLEILLSCPRLDLNQIINGSNAIMYAAELGRTECLKMILEHSVHVFPINLPSNCLSESLLNVAQYSDHARAYLAQYSILELNNIAQQFVSMLQSLHKFDSSQFNFSNQHGQNALERAIAHNHFDCAEALLNFNPYCIELQICDDDVDDDNMTTCPSKQLTTTEFLNQVITVVNDRMDSLSNGKLLSAQLSLTKLTLENMRVQPVQQSTGRSILMQIMHTQPQDLSILQSLERLLSDEDSIIFKNYQF